MVIKTIQCHIKPGKMPEYLKIASEFAKAIRLEDGCISSDLCIAEDMENEAVYIVRWKDKKSAAVHCSGENFNNIWQEFPFLLGGWDELPLLQKKEHMFLQCGEHCVIIYSVDKKGSLLLCVS